MSAVIGLLDPSIGSSNAGDLIIQQAVHAELLGAGVPLPAVAVFSTRRSMSPPERQLAENCRLFIVGGTNLLSSNMPWYRQWKVGVQEFLRYRQRVLLLGVGWWQYQGPPNQFTRGFLTRTLGSFEHSVRDEWTRRQLASIGISALNTACPTMWRLPIHPERSPTLGDNVIVTLTDYNRAPSADRRLLEFLMRLYQGRMALWPQGAKDAAYARSIGYRGPYLQPSLTALESALAVFNTDYVGTRLHAGIRALQAGARTTIIGVDNRAAEIGRDTGLPVIPRHLGPVEQAAITDERSLSLQLPRANIEAWRASLVAHINTLAPA